MVEGELGLFHLSMGGVKVGRVTLSGGGGEGSSCWGGGG